MKVKTDWAAKYREASQRGTIEKLFGEKPKDVYNSEGVYTNEELKHRAIKSSLFISDPDAFNDLFGSVKEEVKSVTKKLFGGKKGKKAKKEEVVEEVEEESEEQND